MSRALALLLALIGGAAAALATIMVLGGAFLGFLWIFVFGDDPWPGWATNSLDIALPLIGMLLWVVFARQVWFRLRSFAL